MRTEDLVSSIFVKLCQFLEQSKAKRIVLAYSGGIDSTVLLHLLSRTSFSPSIELLAVHINHGLHPAADQWEAHCQSVAQNLSVPFRSVRVAVLRTHRQGLEAAAREARYQALQKILANRDLLLTAHHSSDQAETMLLRLMRGAGVSGLSAIAESLPFANGMLARPLLGFTRAAIRAYAEQHQLDWVEDPSNADLSHDRNYLRHQVVPMLSERWQAWDSTVSRAARHQSQADTLLRLEAERWLARCMISGKQCLSYKAFMSLPAIYQKPVLRAWLALCELPTLEESQFDYLYNRMVVTPQSNKLRTPRSGATFAWSGVAVHFYRGQLYANRLLPAVPNERLEWQHGVDFLLPNNGIKLRWTELVRQAPTLSNLALSVDFRRGGECCARGGGKFHQSLKKIFQTYHVPPWQRDRVPLIYAEGRIRLIWNILNCD